MILSQKAPFLHFLLLNIKEPKLITASNETNYILMTFLADLKEISPWDWY